MGKEQELLDAARSGNAALIEKILSGGRKWTAGPLALPLPNLPTIRKGVHSNCQDASGGTPLHYASLNGHKEVVELLLKLQASANIPDQKGCYPLHLSAWRGNADVCRVLLLHGPSVAKVNAQNLEGETALHSAAQYGYNQVVDLLLQNHADPEIKNNKGEKALDLAIQYGRLETVQLLLNAYQNKSRELGPDDRPPLLQAAKNGHKQVLQLLLDAGFNINHQSTTGTVLHEACLYGRLEIVKLLLEKGIDVNIKDNGDKTAIDLLKDLKTPKSPEILKVISDHINGGVTGEKTDRLSTAGEVDYDFPVSHREGSKDRLHSESSLASEGTGAAAEPEESIYDHPRAFQNVLGKKPVAGSSAKADMPLKSPDTPKKPPRKRLPQSVLVKSGIGFDKNENTDLSSDCVKITMTSSNPNLNVTSDRTNVKVSNPMPANNELASHCQTVNSEIKSTSGFSETSKTCVGENMAKDLHGPNFPAHATYRSPLNARPPSLNLNGSRPLICRDIPLSPSNYEQPPTPEHPPPSPMTAILGIQEKLNPKERRRSKDMETITETEFLTAMTAEVSSASTGSKDSGASHSRARPCPSSEGCNVTVVTNRNPYHGLTMGSLPGSQRRVKSQILDNVYIQGSKRISSAASFDTPFDPVIERAEDQDSLLPSQAKFPQVRQKVLPDGKTNRTTSQQTKLNFVAENQEKVTTSPDETEEWAKIEDLITSIGGGLDTDMLVKEFDERMSNVLQTSGCLRVQSVGDWLEGLGLPQYENLFVANGFDDIDFLGPDILDEMDLVEIGISDESHRQKILEASSKFPRMKHFNESQCSVKEWLEFIRLLEYHDTLAKNGFSDLSQVKKLWEVELTSILDITMLGHRKRILASFPKSTNGEKRSVGQNSRDTVSGDVVPNEQLCIDAIPGQELDKVNLFKDYTNLTSNSKAARQIRCQETEILASEMEAGMDGREQDISIGDGLEAAVGHWCHHPEALIKGCCNYSVQYLGSTLVTLLDGTESTKASISKFKRSTENITRVPNIILSISYRGVKFIDEKSKKVICEHEIGNIFCACQDGDSLNYFAYITRDLESDKHYCHVFTVNSTALATEIILTLGEAFEVAYKMAVSEHNQQILESKNFAVSRDTRAHGMHGAAASKSLDTLPGTINSNSYSTAI